MNSMLKKLTVLALLVSVVSALPVQDGQVKAAIDDSEVHNRDTRSLNFGLGWHLDRIDQRSLPLDGKYCPPQNGSGVDIYIFGEGIQHDHAEFGGRAFDGGFSVKTGRCSNAYFGTMIASLAAGSTVGVAKKANVYSIDVLDCFFLYTTVSKVISGIHHVIKTVKSTPDRRAVIALPLYTYYSVPLNNIIMKATKMGIVVVAAAGNQVDSACRYSPASSPDVISVGATTKHDGLYRSFLEGTNYGKCVTLFAPGQLVTAAADNGGYITTTGTSLSCGIVAGAAAQVLEKDHTMSPQKVKEHLITMATEDAIDFSTLPHWELGRTPNRLLYTGNSCVDENDGSGDFVMMS